MTTPAKNAMSMMRLALISAPLAVAALMPTQAQAQNFMENIGRNIGYNIAGAATVNNPNPYSRDVIGTITGEVVASMGRGVDEQRAKEKEDERITQEAKRTIRYEIALRAEAAKAGIPYSEIANRGVGIANNQAAGQSFLNGLNQQNQMLLQQIRRSQGLR